VTIGDGRHSSPIIQRDGRPWHCGFVSTIRVYLASFLSRLPSCVADKLTEWVPCVAEKLTEWFIDSEVRSMRPEIKDEWHLLPAPPIDHNPGVVKDHLIPHLSDGSIISLSGIDRFNTTGIAVDGQEVQADSIIFCTGAYFDYSFLGPEADPTVLSIPEWDTSPHQNSLPYPRLYQTLFHPQHPVSLAFIGTYSGFTFSAFLNAELSSHVTAQIWSGHYPLPSSREISKWCDENYIRSVKQDISMEIISTRS